MNKLRQRVLALAMVLIACLSICTACSATTERITNDELAKLRTEFQYNDIEPEMVSMISYNEAYPTFDALVGADYSKGGEPTIDAVVVLELTGDWYQIDTYVQVFDDSKINSIVEQKTPGIGNISWMVHDAVICDVLWSRENLEDGDSIVLGFGSSVITAGTQHENIYKSGDKYVCFVASEKHTAFKLDNLYSTAKPYSFYLTRNDVILSVTSAPGPDSVSGMYLDAFTTLVNETLGPPDAELTPVEPELETE